MSTTHTNFWGITVGTINGSCIRHRYRLPYYKLKRFLSSLTLYPSPSNGEFAFGLHIRNEKFHVSLDVLLG